MQVEILRKRISYCKLGSCHLKILLGFFLFLFYVR